MFKRRDWSGEGSSYQALLLDLKLTQLSVSPLSYVSSLLSKLHLSSPCYQLSQTEILSFVDESAGIELIIIRGQDFLITCCVGWTSSCVACVVVWSWTPQLGKNFHLSVTTPDGIPQTWPLGKHLSHKMCKHYTTPGLISGD